MTEQSHVVFDTMDYSTCEEFLDRNWMGRIAFAAHSRVDIEPLSYVRRGKWIFGRTSHGTKITVIDHYPWVAFEVDEVEGPFDWCCVVIHGSFYQLSPAGNAFDKNTHREAVAALHELAPEAWTRSDPAPHRTIIFGIHIDSMTGRSASTKS
jgi:uncharacterized protein